MVLSYLYEAVLPAQCLKILVHLPQEELCPLMHWSVLAMLASCLVGWKRGHLAVTCSVNHYTRGTKIAFLLKFPIVQPSVDSTFAGAL